MGEIFAKKSHLSDLLIESITINNEKFTSNTNYFKIICEIPGLILYTHNYKNHETGNEYTFSTISYNNGNTEIELKFSLNSKFQNVLCNLID